MTELQLKKLVSEGHRSYINTFKGLSAKLDKLIEEGNKAIDKFQNEINFKSKRLENEKAVLAILLVINESLKKADEDVDPKRNQVS